MKEKSSVLVVDGAQWRGVVKDLSPVPPSATLREASRSPKGEGCLLAKRNSFIM